MKKTLTLTCMLFVFISYTNGQSVSNPTPGTYLLNTSNQPATGFSVSGFNTGDILLISIGLINQPSGTTLRLNNISGVTASVGYNLSGNFTRVSFTGSQANVNTVLSSLQVNTGSTPGAINITVSATVNPPGYYYLPTNGHFYKPVDWPSGLTGGAEVYTIIKNSAASETFKGQTGYLVTITSQDEQNFIHANVPINNILIALTDKDQEGIWKWDAGPEAGTHIFTQNGVGGTIEGSHYNNWCSNEPNNAGAGENYVVTNWGDPIGNCWNDYGPPESTFSGTIMGGYVVEFGTWTDPANQDFTEFYSGTVTHQSYPPGPTGITATFSAICIGNSTQLTATGVQGTVYWYTGSCGGTQVTTGNPITVSPSLSTTYYARNYDNGQFSIGCASVEIIVYPGFTAGAIATTGETICSGLQPSVVGSTIPAGGGDGNIAYKWQANGSDIASSIAATYSPGVLTLTTTFTRWAKDGTCNTEFTQSSGTWIVTVNPLQQFRSKNGGNWATAHNWEQYTGVGEDWVTANEYPGQNPNSCPNPQVTILAGHEMEIATSVVINIPNLKIEGAGKLTIKSGGKIFVQDQLQLDESAGAAIIVE